VSTVLICVEVIYPSNARSETEEKRLLYFEAGARQVWLCGEDGEMRFFSPEGKIAGSELCAEFPGIVG
jgi:Uma2 family endonuclease